MMNFIKKNVGKSDKNKILHSKRENVYREVLFIDD